MRRLPFSVRGNTAASGAGVRIGMDASVISITTRLQANPIYTCGNRSARGWANTMPKISPPTRIAFQPDRMTPRAFMMEAPASRRRWQ
jgi:hypothetical protein